MRGGVKCPASPARACKGNAPGNAPAPGRARLPRTQGRRREGSPQNADPGPGYPELFALLTRNAQRPQHEQDQLLRIVAGAVLTGNGDMHRRNLGVSHSLPDEAGGVTLAPLYDAGAFPGIEPVYRGHRYAPAPYA